MPAVEATVVDFAKTAVLGEVIVGNATSKLTAVQECLKEANVFVPRIQYDPKRSLQWNGNHQRVDFYVVPKESVSNNRLVEFANDIIAPAGIPNIENHANEGWLCASFVEKVGSFRMVPEFKDSDESVPKSTRESVTEQRTTEWVDISRQIVLHVYADRRVCATMIPKIKE